MPHSEQILYLYRCSSALYVWGERERGKRERERDGGRKSEKVREGRREKVRERERRGEKLSETERRGKRESKRERTYIYISTFTKYTIHYLYRSSLKLLSFNNA